MKVDLRTEDIKRKVIDRCIIAQYALDNKIAADSNYFCPEDTGDLQKSVQPIMGNGVLEWNTPYAKAQYYGLPGKSTDTNPNASLQWFEQAKARELDNWVGVANAEYNK